jgi:hypothetical protein
MTMRTTVLLLLLSIAHLSYSQQRRQWCYNSTINVKDPRVGQYMQLALPYDFEHNEANFDYVLDSAASMVNNLKGYVFAIESHSDCRSDSLYNYQVTQHKADRICALMHNTQKLNNLVCLGKGETQPISGCRCERRIISKVCTEEEYQLDRRIILRIIDKMP